MTTPNESKPASGTRLASLDALRGFDMFWIIGGAGIVSRLCRWSSSPFVQSLAGQFEHPEWEGFTFFDQIFPLFLFMIGVAIPFSLTKRLALGDSRLSIYGHAIVRVGWMIFFGMMINGNLLTYDPKQFQLTYSVLQMLALGYLVGVAGFLHFGVRGRLVLTTALLVVYFVGQRYVPLPRDAFKPGVFAEHANFGDWLNDQILGSWQGSWRFGWIFEITTHGATCLMGVTAGELLKGDRSPWAKIGALAFVGVALIAVALAWGLIDSPIRFPIIKNRWTSSFALLTGGISCLMLATAYLLVDVWNLRRWAYPFEVIGTNAIVAYLGWNILGDALFQVPWKLFGGLKGHLGEEPLELLIDCGRFATLWIVLWQLHRTKSFVRL